jgi:hypothetical protein
MRVTIDLRRVARRSIASLLGALLLATPAVVLASHQFPDVPDGNPFHDQISAIAEAGITAGFNDGGYHPTDAVTRQAMAAFMQRGFGRVGLAGGSVPINSFLPAVTTTAGAVAVRDLTITVPGSSNAFSPVQMVHLQGHVEFFSDMTAAGQGCPCEFFAFIRDLTTGDPSLATHQTFISPTATAYTYSFDVEGLFSAPPGPRTYELQVGLWNRSSGANASNFTLSNNSSLSAMTFPFGPTGTNDL